MGQKIGGSEKMKRSRVGGGSKGSVTSENWGVTPYDGLYGKAPPDRGTFSRLQAYKKGWYLTS